MKRQDRDEQFAGKVPGVLEYHKKMLADGVRNSLLLKAIKKHVNKETSFLDVGAGTGVWAVIAAKLGAKRVVAIEVEECLIPIIHKHAQENGVGDRIEIVHGDSNNVKLRGKFDCIVSELFGGNAFGKETVESFVDLRNRFLAKDGVLIPQGLDCYAVPVFVDDSVETVPAKLPITCEFLKSLKRNYSRTADLDSRRRIKFLSEPKRLVELDFRTIEIPPALDFTAEWKLRNISKANAFAMFNASIFTEEIRMNSFDSQSWGTSIFEFKPFKEKAGTIKLDLKMEEKTMWTVSIPSNGNLKPETYAPAFAIARLRMNQKMTPYKKYGAPKATTKRSNR